MKYFKLFQIMGIQSKIIICLAKIIIGVSNQFFFLGIKYKPNINKFT